MFCFLDLFCLDQLNYDLRRIDVKYWPWLFLLVVIFNNLVSDYTLDINICFYS